MAYRNDRWLDQTGLNLIRIVIGSYFMAIALGLITGVDPSAMFWSWMDLATADLIGTTLLFSVTVAFMAGLYLRMTSLMLALFVLSSSLVENALSYDGGEVSFFWRDLTLACAVLLSYSTLKRRDFRKAALIGQHRPRHIAQNTGDVVPRRIAPSAKVTRRSSEASYDRVLRPLIAPTQPIIKENLDTTRQEHAPNDTAPARKPVAFGPGNFALTDAEDDCANIFADV